jgi:hypothetical protein
MTRDAIPSRAAIPAVYTTRDLDGGSRCIDCGRQPHVGDRVFWIPPAGAIYCSSCGVTR